MRKQGEAREVENIDADVEKTDADVKKIEAGVRDINADVGKMDADVEKSRWRQTQNMTSITVNKTLGTCKQTKPSSRYRLQSIVPVVDLSLSYQLWC